MAASMWLRVRITERAAGHIVTLCDPDDGYYPFEIGFEDGGTENISSVGYAEVCCIDGDDTRGIITRVLVERAVSARFGRDVPLDTETLRAINRALPEGRKLPELPQEDEIPDPADIKAITEHPGRFAFEYMLENYYGQKTRN